MSDDNNKENTETNVYYLASSDNPGLILTTFQLKKINYSEWVKAMRLAIRAKKKLGFVDGLIPKPEDNNDKEEEWWTVNTMVGSRISNTIESSLKSTISYLEQCHEL